jgi:hypothetical protein
MKLKETNELLSIWVRNDRSEWTDEAFIVIHDLLQERIESVPTQRINSVGRRHQKKAKVKPKIPLVAKFFLGFVLLIFIQLLLLPFMNQVTFNRWYDELFFSTLTVFCFGSGFYFCWMGFFKSESITKGVKANLPEMKKAGGLTFRFYTFFLPDRLIPAFWVIAVIYGGISMIYGGVLTLTTLLEIW